MYKLTELGQAIAPRKRERHTQLLLEADDDIHEHSDHAVASHLIEIALIDRLLISGTLCAGDSKQIFDQLDHVSRPTLEITAQNVRACIEAFICKWQQKGRLEQHTNHRSSAASPSITFTHLPSDSQSIVS